LSHTSIQLIAIAHPLQANFWDIVESYKIVISRQAMDRFYADLFQSQEEILSRGQARLFLIGRDSHFSNVNWVLELLGTQILSHGRNSRR